MRSETDKTQTDSKGTGDQKLHINIEKAIEANSEEIILRVIVSSGIRPQKKQRTAMQFTAQRIGNKLDWPDSYFEITGGLGSLIQWVHELNYPETDFNGFLENILKCARSSINAHQCVSDNSGKD